MRPFYFDPSATYGCSEYTIHIYTNGKKKFINLRWTVRSPVLDGGVVECYVIE